jgi:23S rRNA (pseudouridine1915-N3)-methyltransferase
MRTVAILSPEIKKEPWLDAARSLYLEKISHYIKCELIAVKSPTTGRDQSERKLQAEEENLLKAIKPEDFVVLLDERGKQLDSLDFSKFVMQEIESGQRGRVVFVIGGAFGVGDDVRKRANKTISLSKLVFAHTMAHAVLLEQIYRAFAIAKNHPYHNP